MQIGTCVFYCAPLMSEPNHKSEMETQILFGESVEILETKSLWIKVRALWDGYEGWMLKQQAIPISNFIAADYINISENALVTCLAISNSVPWGASLPLLESNTFGIGDGKYMFKGIAQSMVQNQFVGENLIQYAKSFLQVPYMWGGRTHAGIDCSGLSAIVYKAFGLALRHDASWQVQQGQNVDFLQNGLAGDLAFFDNAEGAITHVGILIDANTIIHATETAGGVTIDDIDTQGIISRISGQHTHRLRIIKRLL
jgi:gamma-D-glutamyl-L-lysine dipeptidyl-peptidase